MKKIFYRISTIILLMSIAFLITGCATDEIENYSGTYRNTNGDTNSYIVVNSDSTCDLHNVSGITEYDCSYCSKRSIQ